MVLLQYKGVLQVVRTCGPAARLSKECGKLFQHRKTWSLGRFRVVRLVPPSCLAAVCYLDSVDPFSVCPVLYFYFILFQRFGSARSSTAALQNCYSGVVIFRDQT